jgi:pilus assembly protein Flp/PilA
LIAKTADCTGSRHRAGLRAEPDWGSREPPDWFQWNSRSNSLASIHPALKSVPDSRPMKLFYKFLADETGATAIEYGLIAAGISLAIIAAINGLGTTLKTKFTSINTSLK